MLTILITVLLVIVGGWVTSDLFKRKDRDPVTGAIIGCVAGLWPPVLIVVIVLAWVMPKRGSSVSLPALPSLSGRRDRSVKQQLEELQAMQTDGLITQAEFKEKKAAILAQL